MTHGNNCDTVQGELNALRRALDEEKNSHLRTLADFDNYRKRMDREYETLSSQGKKDMARDLIKVLDGMEKAVSQARDEKMQQGLHLIYGQFMDVLTRHGLERVESLGKPFDPALHEALGYTESRGCPPGYVAEELACGYKFGKELLRPAMVRVAKG